MEDLLKTLIQFALKKRASDIHFIWEHNHLNIQLRTIFGMLPLYQDIWQKDFLEYLKYISNFDLTNPQLPQSGQFEVNLNHQIIFCRFSLIVNKEIQTGVLRILNSHQNLTIDELTENQDHIKKMKELCTYRQGLVISVGPTNTGKTTTLHAILHEIALRHRFKIVSLEDPIEIEDDNYVQLEINEQQGFTYEKGIEELLRHDPDIIFIGETRNAYTAHMVVRAALTGHLVFTTLHAKNSLECIQRLYDFGLTKYDILNTLTTIIGQRLYAKDKEGRKQCIYEILSKKELQYTIQHNQYSESFNSLEKEIQKALDQGIIQDPQAYYDIESFKK